MASLFKPSYTKMNPRTGQEEKRQSRKWYVKYRDADGIVRRVPGFTDKEATRQHAAKLERGAELARVCRRGRSSPIPSSGSPTR